jgi:hypothetical protein
MMIGPAPMMRMEEMSVRLGIAQPMLADRVHSMTIYAAKALPLRGGLGGVDCIQVSSADALARSPSSNLLPAGEEA